MSQEKPRAEEYYLDIHRDSSWKGNQGGQRLGSKIQFLKKCLSTYLPIYLFGCAGSQLQHVDLQFSLWHTESISGLMQHLQSWLVHAQLWPTGSSSLTRDQTRVPPLGTWGLSQWTTRKSQCPFMWTWQPCRNLGLKEMFWGKQALVGNQETLVWTGVPISKTGPGLSLCGLFQD